MMNEKSLGAGGLAAIGVGLEALILGIWSITVLVSGLSGETVVTEDGSDTTLGIFMLVIAILLAGIALAVWKQVRFATGPAITLQVLLIGGAVISTDFLHTGFIIAIIIYAVLVGTALINLRRRQYSNDL
ncbi:hypothetical protein [Flaviflexus massiliensis]|uniref:hypothetical protein n=1 Tax=Flaviflexus massiliensis TaxID=1522309 RepID=UPI0006D53AC1|nr:hypothetical protein [Flaviflexus massiliensis]